MMLDLWSLFIVNVGMNSLLSFWTLSCFILLSLKLLRIHNPRLQAFCLFLPFLKLVLDLVNYQFAQWAFMHNVNPLESPEGTRFFTIGFLSSFLNYPFCQIAFHLQNGQTFTIADLFCFKIGSFWTTSLAIVWLAGTLIFIGKACWHYRNSRQWLKHMKQSSQICSQLIQDPFLKTQLERKRVFIYLSESLHAPCIIGQRNPSIFLPRAVFNQLTVEEFEAVLAHEMAHLQHGDLIMNAYLFWICHCFWWIPVGYLRQRLELAQECASDRLLRTQLTSHHLAEALYKTAQWLHTSHSVSFAQPAATSHHAVKRLRILLAEPKQTETIVFKWIKSTLLFIWISILICSKFWTF